MNDPDDESSPGGTASDPDEYIGEVLDERFRLDSLLGKGAMGHVYRATQLSVDRDVAVKILRDEIRLNQSFRQRFSREAKVISDFNHPNIVRLIDFYKEDERGLSYLVMELVEGVELSEPLSEGALAPAFAFEIVYQIAAALVEAHGEGIVHRDLKLENIHLVPLSNGTCQVKVLDFGVALPKQSSVKLTSAGQIFGTPAYMSPEQAKGEEVDERSDLYSLGIILFEMLTGRLPLREATNFKMMMAHAQQPPPSLSDVLPMDDIPDEADALISDLLAKSPDDRPQTADEVRSRIDAIREEANWPDVEIDADAPTDEMFEPWMSDITIDQGPIDKTFQGQPPADRLTSQSPDDPDSADIDIPAPETASPPESEEGDEESGSHSEVALEDTLASPSGTDTAGGVDKAADADAPTRDRSTTWEPDTVGLDETRRWLAAGIVLLLGAFGVTWYLLSNGGSPDSPGEPAARAGDDRYAEPVVPTARSTDTGATMATGGGTEKGSAGAPDAGEAPGTEKRAAAGAESGESAPDAGTAPKEDRPAETAPDASPESKTRGPKRADRDSEEASATGSGSAEEGRGGGRPDRTADEQTSDETARSDRTGSTSPPDSTEPAAGSEDEPGPPPKRVETDAPDDPSGSESAETTKSGEQTSAGTPPDSLPPSDEETNQQPADESSEGDESKVDEAYEQNQEWLTNE